MMPATKKKMRNIAGYLFRLLMPGLICTLFLLSGCASVSVDEEKEAEFHYKMGMSSLNEGDTQSAFVQLQKALQLNPYDKDILGSVGIVYMQMNDPETAKDFFSRAVAQDPGFSDGYHNLGVANLKTGQWLNAVDAFKKALTNPLFQTPEKTFCSLGIAYYRLGQFSLAENSFKDAIRRSTQIPLPYFGLALVYNKQSKYGDASAALTHALGLDHDYSGDKKKFIEDMKKKIFSAKGEEEQDFKDYLEIVNY